VKETVEPQVPCDGSKVSGKDKGTYQFSCSCLNQSQLFYFFSLLLDLFLSEDEPFFEFNFVDDPSVEPELVASELTGNVKGWFRVFAYMFLYSD